MKELDHPNVLRVFDVYEDYHNYYFVLEFASSGDAWDYIEKQIKLGCYSQKFFRQTIENILSSVCYIHSENIIHRDIKFDNFLVDCN